MRKILLLCVLLGALVCTASAPAPMSSQQMAAHHLTFGNVLDTVMCSGTSVAPHTILTAGHCLIAGTEINVDGEAMTITHFEFDGADHMLLTVDGTFAQYLPIDERDAVTDEMVHFWGWPGKSPVSVARSGEYISTDTDSFAIPIEIFRLPVFGGDSGSGVISNAGKVITVISLGDKSAGRAACFPLQFTVAQLAAIR